MSKYGKMTSQRNTPQSQQAHPDQVKNNAGGFSFKLGPFEQFERFLILGSMGGTYYGSERKLTLDNANVIDQCASLDGKRTIDMIVDVSVNGRAPKQDPAIYALARLAGHKDLEVRKAALGALNQVCRIGTHLFSFLSDVEEFRGWGRLLRTAVSNWYLDKEPRALAYQITKYQQREGESHRDALRRAHPGTQDTDLNEVLRYAAQKLTVDPEWTSSDKPHRRLFGAVEAAKHADKASQIVDLIEKHDLVRECIPTQWLNDPKVWEALFQKMPLGAMVRNLAKMTTIGLIAPMSDVAIEVVSRLENTEAIRKARIHPLAMLFAQATYGQGHGFRGSNRWSPVPQITAALDDAFYTSFENVEPTGKRFLLGLDISGSMGYGYIANSFVTPAMGAAAMAMVTMKAEKNWYCHGFSGHFVDLKLHDRMSLPEVLTITNSMNFGSTDCSVPMNHALQHKIPVDTFCVYTDNETWVGNRNHPFQALEKYRQKMGIPAKLVVIGMTATDVTIANPNDPGMLDVVGFDASTPRVISDFATQNLS